MNATAFATEPLLALLARCGGYYEKPPGGPLVGYAGRYDKGLNGPDDPGKQYVGKVYVNFAMAERRGQVLDMIAMKIQRVNYFLRTRGTGFCAAPEGGKALAVALATLTNMGYIFPEKEIVALKSETSREQSKLVWKRHEPKPGESWWIVEDICNNFSTTLDMVKLIEDRGAMALGIVCFLNRSLTVNGIWSPTPGRELPVYAAVQKPIEEYRQDDPEVAVDVGAGNIIWKPKDEWPKLQAAMGAFD